MSATTPPIVKDLRYLRQPHILVAGAEVHGTIFDGGVIRSEADLRQRGDEIRFQLYDLKAVRGDPGAPPKWDRVSRALGSQLIGANGIGSIGPLVKMDLPSWRAVRPRQSLTGKGKALKVRRMKNEYQGGQPCGGDTIGKLGRRIMRVPILLHIQQAEPVLLNGNNIVELELDGTRRKSPLPRLP